MSLLVSIDNGGTLTDVCAVRDGEVFFGKTLTTPHDLSQCFVDALSVLATQLYGEADLQRLAGEVEHIRYSTTQGTNALVQRKGPRLGVVVDAQEAAKALTSGGASDALLADLVADRIAVIDFSAEDKDLEAAIVAVVNDLTAQGANRLVVSFGGDDFSEKEQRFRRFVYKRYPRHLLGAVPLVFAGHLSKAESQTQRTWAAILNSFLHPAMEHFLYNAENHLRDLKARNPLLIYRNDGGSTRVA
ncbi:MAG: hydantoinase/oxoprolinase N-terminal domain-containing protein, partial [Pseudomonadota bacterium]